MLSRLKKFVNIRLPLVVGLLITAFMLLVANIGFAEEVSSNDAEVPVRQPISFPIAELGNCEDKEACREYCKIKENESACTAFGLARGLINKEKAEKAEKFQEKLRLFKAGPGGCDSGYACREYCSNFNNIEECVAFAEDNGLSGSDFNRGQRFLAYIKSGGATPGDCSNDNECRLYCQNFDHLEECVAFQEAMHGNEENDDIGLKRSDLSKLAALAKAGKTPGGCKSKSECEAYCKNPANTDECIDFSLKIGAIGSEDAERIRKLRNEGGPGGCTTKEECQAFCNKKENRAVCSTFAKEHNLIPKKRPVETKQNTSRLRELFTNAPAPMRECLKNILPNTSILGSEEDSLASEEVARQIKNCLDSFREQTQRAPDDKGVESDRSIFSTAIAECIREKADSLGSDNFYENNSPLSISSQRIMLECIELHNPNQNTSMPPEASSDLRGVRPVITEESISELPEKVLSCMKSSFGESFREQAEQGSISEEEIKSALERCRAINAPAFPFSIKNRTPITVPDRLRDIPAPSTPIPDEKQDGSLQGGSFINTLRVFTEKFNN